MNRAVRAFFRAEPYNTRQLERTAGNVPVTKLVNFEATARNL